jgi:hypothetical protein
MRHKAAGQAGSDGTWGVLTAFELEEPDTIGFGIHFADVVFGQVRRDGDGPAWRPLDA